MVRLALLLAPAIRFGHSRPDCVDAARFLQEESLTEDPQTFHVGLTMAGAISAGAYTAGVLDTLIEALDRHNARFEAGRRGDWQGDLAGHPRHRVVLRVISGTSAGGVSAGLAVAGLLAARNDEGGAEDGGGRQVGGTRDGSFTSDAGYRYEYRYLLKPLHHVWVEALELYRQTGGGAVGFLTTGDLSERPVDSALNSEHIDEAARVALSGIAWTGKPFRFLSQDFDLFLTTTNLQGVPYAVGFAASGAGGSPSHVMAQHSTVRHFRITGLGTEPCRSVWLDSWRDHGIPLPLTPGAVVDFEAPGTPWARFKTAALATGAFPVGLAARVIDAEAADFGVAAAEGTGDGSIQGGAWPINLKPGIEPDTRPKPDLGAATAPGAGVTYVAVDGGVANNEPFELARYTLLRGCEGHETFPPGDKFLESNPRDAETADRAVLMIDPFPEGPVFTPLSGEEARALAGVVPAARRLLPALINQARFKPGELIEATDARVFSRYLLSPSRRERDDAGNEIEDGKSWRGADAIASGSFGGFGGFFDRSFRAHDYMLGQRNAHSFLKRYFNLRSDNPVLGLPGAERDRRAMVRVVEAGDDFYAAEPPIPRWPRIGRDRLDPILKQAEERIGKLAGKVLKDMGLTWFLRLALGGVWSWDVLGGAGDKVAVALRAKVLHELIRRDQHEAFRERAPGRPFAAWERAVLVRLAGAGDRPVPMKAAGGDAKDGGGKDGDLLAAAREEGAGEAELRAFLESREMQDRLWHTSWREAEDMRYTLAELKPAYAWTQNVRAVTDRIGGFFGR